MIFRGATKYNIIPLLLCILSALDTTQTTTDSMMSFWSPTGTEGPVGDHTTAASPSTDDIDTDCDARTLKEMRALLHMYEKRHAEDSAKITNLQGQLRGSLSSSFDPVIPEEVNEDEFDTND